MPRRNKRDTNKGYKRAGVASVVESLQKGKCQKEITGA